MDGFDCGNCEWLCKGGHQNKNCIKFFPAYIELLEALEDLVRRIELEGGLGEYKGGPIFVMNKAKQAISTARR